MNEPFSTIDSKAESAASWNSYAAAPDFFAQVNVGNASTVASAAGLWSRGAARRGAGLLFFFFAFFFAATDAVGDPPSSANAVPSAPERVSAATTVVVVMYREKV